MARSAIYWDEIVVLVVVVVVVVVVHSNYSLYQLGHVGNWSFIPETDGYWQFVPRSDVNQKCRKKKKDKSLIYTTAKLVPINNIYIYKVPLAKVAQNGFYNPTGQNFYFSPIWLRGHL